MPNQKNTRSELLDSIALLVLDAQDCFIDTLHDKERFLKRCAFAIEAARNLRIETIFTEQAPDKLGHTNHHLLSLARKPRVFPKKTFSALRAPGFDSFLRDKEIYHLLIVGLETPICVYQTALQAAEEDIDATFLYDGLGCRRAEDAEPTLEAIRRLSCQVLPSETLFYSLLGDVSNPYFRVLNGLVKSYSNPEFDMAPFDPANKPERPERIAEADDDSNPEERSNKRRRPSRRRRGGRRSEDKDREAPPANDESSKETAPIETPSAEKPTVETEKPVPEKPKKKIARKAVKKATRKTAAKKATKKVAKKAIAKETESPES